ncbi:MAG: glycosyltransferase family 117 protein [Rubrobacteraceae bacterium]
MSGRGGLLAGVFVAAAAFVVYLRTLAPTMLYYDPDGMYDSVMLQTKAYLLSIPNPTGYPSYMIIAHLFTYLPFGDVGYRVNLVSAVFAALAVFFVYFVCKKLTGRVLPAAAAAFLFGISREFWSQAVIAEVYTFNIFFIALDILVLLIWREKREDRYLLLFAFLMGLSMTGHMTSGLLIPAAAIFISLLDWRKLLEWKLLLKGAGLYVLGLLPYLYLPVRSAMGPPLNESEPHTLSNFLDLVTGSNFESRMFAFGMDEMPERLGMYADYLANQFNPLLLLLAVLGAFHLAYKKEVAVLAMLMFLHVGWLVYALGYNIRDVYVYFIPTYLIICFFIAVGFGNLMDLAERSLARFRLAPRAAALAVTSALIVAMPLAGFEKAHGRADRSDDMHGRHIMDEVIREVPEGSAVMHSGGVMWYMKYVTDHRSDLKVVDPFPSGGWSAESPHWIKAAERNIEDGRRVFILFPSGTENDNKELFRSAGYELLEHESGYFHEVVVRQRAADGETMVPMPEDEDAVETDVEA